MDFSRNCPKMSSPQNDSSILSKESMYSPCIDFGVIGQKLRTEREKHGWTQEKAAEKVGITPAFMGHIERGERRMSFNTLIRLCNLYRVTMDYLLSDTLPPEHDNVTMQISDMIKNKPKEQQAAILDILRAIVRHI
jgi:transcriptional regulator with XRE-family HTH domain